MSSLGANELWNESQYRSGALKQPTDARSGMWFLLVWATVPSDPARNCGAELGREAALNQGCPP